MKKRRISPNLTFLRNNYLQGTSGVILEGSSRSTKTWSGIDFLLWLCSFNQNLVINIIKETHASFKTTLYNDFNRRLPMYGLASPFADKKEVSSFSLYGNRVNLLGADNAAKFHGAGCDVFWINEALDVSQDIFDQSEMRCRKFWFMDYNPKVTDHWIFERVEPRDDAKLLKTTFVDNPYISAPEKRKILSYNPNNPENVRQGTADDYMWNVYGLGLRSAPEGLIFQHVTWIEKFPENCEHVYWGLDFGYTNSPTVLGRAGIIGNDLFAECLFYEPTPSINELLPVLRTYCPNETVWADPSGDSGGRGMISLSRRNGFRVLAASTFPGSIKYGISLIKKFKIHLVDHPAVRKEQSNYRYREVQGIRLDEPVDDHNHFWDQLRMSLMSNIRK